MSTLAPDRERAPAPPTPTVIIEPTHGWLSLQLDRVWAYRELLYFLIWRDVKVRYKQTLLGVAWIVLQPVISMLIFTVLFGLLLNVPSGDVPYPVFALAGLVPWGYFSSSLQRASTSVVGSANASLITKVYFPRLIIPLTGVLSGLLDFAVAFGVLLIIIVLYGIPFTWHVLLLPVFLLLALLTALAFSLWLATLNVRYRDVNQLVPFFIQMWMYVTPVVYGISLIPAPFRWLLALNPMTAVVEGFRWSLLGPDSTGVAASPVLFAISILITLVVLVTGAAYFRRTERTFADII